MKKEVAYSVMAWEVELSPGKWAVVLNYKGDYRAAIILNDPSEYKKTNLTIPHKWLGGKKRNFDNARRDAMNATQD